MAAGASHATSGQIPRRLPPMTRNAVVAATQPVSIPFMCSNHQCIGDAGGRSQ